MEESRSVLVGFWLYNGVSARLAVCEGKPIGGCGLRRRVGVWIVGRLAQASAGSGFSESEDGAVSAFHWL